MRQNRPTMSLHTTFGAIATAIALLQAIPCSALSCDELKSEVEAKIRAAGVTTFSVTVVDAGMPPTTGKVVGTCDRGAKTLLYTQGMSTPPAREASATGVKKADEIITECKDGSEPVRGTCKK
jgi:hypothetical protein